MSHVHLRLLRLAGDIRWYLAGGVALGLAVTATYVVQGILAARVLAGAFQGSAGGEVGSRSARATSSASGPVTCRPSRSTGSRL